MVLGATCSCRLEPETPNLPTKIMSLILRAYGLRFHNYPSLWCFPSSPSTNGKPLECLPLAPWGSTGRTCIKKPKDKSGKVVKMHVQIRAKTAWNSKPVFHSSYCNSNRKNMFWSHMMSHVSNKCWSLPVAGPLVSSRLAQPNTFRTYMSIIHWPLGIDQPPSQHCR